MMNSVKIMFLFSLWAFATALLEGSDTDCDRACTADYKPVCGTFTRTFANECNLNTMGCRLQKFGVNLLDVQEGACEQCRTACPQIYNPVCGSDGKSYLNQCVMRSVSCGTGQWIEVKSMGHCPTEAPEAEGETEAPEA